MTRPRAAFLAPLPLRAARARDAATPRRVASRRVAPPSTSRVRRVHAHVSAHAAPEPAPSPSPAPSSSHARTSQPAASFTSLQGNSFLVTVHGLSLLVDPWLDDELVFVHPSFFRARKTWPRADAAAVSMHQVDAIVLTQALPDHAHVPSLKRLPKHIPVVAPPSAAALLRPLAFEHVTLLAIGESASPLAHAPLFSVRALKGAMVGPPWSTPENAYMFTFQHDPHSVPFRMYHEPHGTFDKPSLKAFVDELDVVIMPVVSAKLTTPIGSYTLVNGWQQALQCCEYVRPNTCVLFNNASAQYSGALAAIVTTEGDAQSFKQRLNNHRTLSGLNVVSPQVAGKRYAIDVPTPPS